MNAVAAVDIAGLAATELTRPRGGHRIVREPGSYGLSMREVAAIVGPAIDEPIDYPMIYRRAAAADTPETFPP